MSKSKRATKLALAAMVVSLMSAVPVSAHNGATQQQADMHPFPGAADLDPAGESSRSASLVRTDSGISFLMQTNSLTPGDVVTVWYVIFNNPGECINAGATGGPRCDLPDLFTGADIGLSVMWGAGSIVDENGAAAWAGHIREGQLNVGHPMLGNGDGLTDARGAEVHLVVHTHGPARAGYIADQLHSFETDGDVVADLQAAAFRGEG